MKRLLIIVCLAAAALMLTSEAAQARHMHRSKGNSGTYQGTIVAIHVHSIVLDIGTNGPKHLMVAISPHTKISDSAGKSGSIGDLVAGEVVSATVKKSRATSITVTVTTSVVPS